MKAGPMTNLGSIGGAPDPTTVPEVATGMNKYQWLQAREGVLARTTHERNFSFFPDN